MMYATAALLAVALLFGAVKKGRLSPLRGPSLQGATGWLNTPPLSLEQLRGKVVLIEFWTYTCINWRRALPYTRAWASKYRDYGLVVIGVHTPEFTFEHKGEHVSRAVRDMNIDYPVAQDNDFTIWDSFQNAYWPALYLLDAKGRLRYRKFGEGDYAEAEKQIQQLLKETSAPNFPENTVFLQPQGYEAAPDWDNLQSPENFLGYNRTRGFASPEKRVYEKDVPYTAPGRLKLNQWALSGAWTLGKEQVRLSKGQGKVFYRFHARDLHLIMAPAAEGTAVPFRVLLDGRPPGTAHGLDTDSSGYGTLKESRMYQLIRQKGPITAREFQIEFLSPGVEVYDFTFG